MAKHEKKHEAKHDTKIIQLKDYQREQDARVEYGKTEDQVFEADSVGNEGEAEDRGEKTPRALPKAVYHIAVVLLLVVIGLALWVNREYLTVENIKEWARVQVLGEGGGDGFPVQITGTSVYESNFLSYGGSAVTLSNTALTITGSDGEQLMSARHDLNQPVLRAAGGRYMIYNGGSTGYTLYSGGSETVSAVAEHDIITGALCGTGRFALGLEGGYGASLLQVFMPDGELQYEYPFSSDYITAIALNYDGSMGAVCTVQAQRGEMVSKLTIFDFTSPDPVAQYESRGNLLLAAQWGENGVIYAVGDAALVSGKSSDYQFSEYDYQGRQLTSFHIGAGRVFLSASSYELAGPSILLVYNGNEAFGENNPVRIERSERIESISTFGGVVGILEGDQIAFCDYTTGMELGTAQAGGDAKSLALMNERTAYVLGVSEIRVVSAE